LTRELILDLYSYWNATYKAINSATNLLELADSDEFWQTLDGGTGILKNTLHLDAKDLRRNWKAFQEGTCENFETQDQMACILSDFMERDSLFFMSSGEMGAMDKTVIGIVKPGDYLYVVIIASARMPFCARLEQGRYAEAFRLLWPCFVPGRCSQL
jgi:hypothetical protein